MITKELLGYILAGLVAVVGVSVLLSSAARKKRVRLRDRGEIGPERIAILDALKKGERIRAVFDASDRTDLECVREFLAQKGIPCVLDEEGMQGQEEGFLPRDLVPLTLFVLRRDEERARQVIADYLRDKGKRPG
jgi:hypothetical protein